MKHAAGGAFGNAGTDSVPIRGASDANRLTTSRTGKTGVQSLLFFEANKEMLVQYLSPVMRFVFISGCLVVLAAIVFWNAARWLVVDTPARSDVILILDGSFDGHFAKGLGMFQGGYGKQIVVTENADRLVFGRTRADLANRFIKERMANWPTRIDVCPTRGDLRESVTDVIRCVPDVGVQSILLVTTDYETRRTLSIFNRLVPKYHWSVAAVEDPSQFGSKWWRHRQWAKNVVVEWSDLLWWNCVDRWQKP